MSIGIKPILNDSKNKGALIRTYLLHKYYTFQHCNYLGLFRIGFVEYIRYSYIHLKKTNSMISL